MVVDKSGVARNHTVTVTTRPTQINVELTHR